jgi:hypothetical protein
MKMLEAGGVSIVTDGVRKADVDNPRGYYEHERVKNLEQETDKSYIGEARGQVIKVISHLLHALPDDCFYRVILMRRHLDEVVRSQNSMLERLGEDQAIEDARAVELYRKHLIHTKVMLRERPNFALLELQYEAAFSDAVGVARKVIAFLERDLEPEAMATAVDPTLYRNRSTAR